MSDATRAKRNRFKMNDVFLSLRQRFSCEGWRQTKTSLGITVTEYELQARCCDCKTAFSQFATRAKIRRDALRRRCDDCKKPGRMTSPVWAQRMTIAIALAPQKAAAARERSAEARRAARAKAPPSRLEMARIQRIQALAAATGKPVSLGIGLSALFRAEQQHLKRTWTAYQRTAKMLGVPVAEVAKFYAERNDKRGTES